jgi:hypothetical protein
MDLTHAVETVWAIAQGEAAGAGFEEVEPEHFVCALTKLAELAEAQIQAAAADPARAASILAERERLKGRLVEVGIDGRRLRHAVRRFLGKGKQAPARTALHRSEASRGVFAQASRDAARGGQPLATGNLLAVLLAAPSAVLKRALVESGAEGAAKVAAGDRPGPAMARIEGHSGGPASAHDPQPQALVRILRRPEQTALVLACEPGVPLGAVLERAAAGLEKLGTSCAQLDVESLVLEGGATDETARRMMELVGAFDGTAPIVVVDLTSPRCRGLLRRLDLARDWGRRLVVAAAREEAAPLGEEEGPGEGRVRLVHLHDLEGRTLPSAV